MLFDAGTFPIFLSWDLIHNSRLFQDIEEKSDCYPGLFCKLRRKNPCPLSFIILKIAYDWSSRAKGWYQSSLLIGEPFLEEFMAASSESVITE